jgi:hypothetical protein
MNIRTDKKELLKDPNNWCGDGLIKMSKTVLASRIDKVVLIVTVQNLEN